MLRSDTTPNARTKKRKREKKERNKKKKKKNIVKHFHSTRKNRLQRKSIDPVSVPRLPIFIPARSNGNGNKHLVRDMESMENREKRENLLLVVWPWILQLSAFPSKNSLFADLSLPEEYKYFTEKNKGGYRGIGGSTRSEIIADFTESIYPLYATEINVSRRALNRDKEMYAISSKSRKVRRISIMQTCQTYTYTI